jgi:chromate transporter
VVATVTAVGYAAHGVGVPSRRRGGLRPVVLLRPARGGRFERLRGNDRARGFLDGAGPAAIGAILGSSVTLAGALSENWQIGVLAGAAIALLIVRRGVVGTLVLAGAVGAGLALAGAPLP